MSSADRPADSGEEPSPRSILVAIAVAMAGVALTRSPVARPAAVSFDEGGCLEMIRGAWFPMHHTLFLAAARRLGRLVGDPYRGFVALDMAVSAAALAALWWWLRALVRPATAAAAAVALGAAPL